LANFINSRRTGIRIPDILWIDILSECGTGFRIQKQSVSKFDLNKKQFEPQGNALFWISTSGAILRWGFGSDPEATVSMN
jgi:hypothetical protein